ncbi:hypothetical protein ACN5O4_05935 [Aliarcobacter butzleri]|uniref:hypothetical protein n=1 Tax=Aliarcobacter butzleri TaxID=28197 RepID=UPI003AF75492
MNKIKLIGIGGGGSNIVKYLINSYPHIYKSLLIDDNEISFEDKICEIKNFVFRDENIYIVCSLGGEFGTIFLNQLIKEFRNYSEKLNFILTTPFTFQGKTKLKKTNELLDNIKRDYLNVYISPNNDFEGLEKDSQIVDFFNAQNEKFHQKINCKG